MSLESIGGKYLPMIPDTMGKKDIKGPDNYPAYGDKKPEAVPEDSVAIRSSKKHGHHKGKPLPEAPPESEGPDNYPSYGDKTTPDGKPPEKPVTLLPAPKTQTLQLQDYYALMDPAEVFTEGPDNYPSYGDKCIKPFTASTQLLSLSLDDILEAGPENSRAEGPDNYPSYGDR
jgi:hypothetical protein